MRRWLSLCLGALMMAAVMSPAAMAAEPKPIELHVGGKMIEVDAAPFQENGRTLVPLRAVTQSMGFTVDFDQATQKITLVQAEQGVVIELWVDSTKVLVNGEEFTLDVAVKSTGGRTFVPVRFLAERLGASVAWDGAAQAVRVNPGAAHALMARAVEKQSAPDMTMTMDGGVSITVHTSGISFKGDIGMKQHMQAHQKEALVTTEMTPKEYLAQVMPSMKTRMAIKGGKVYQQMPDGAWTIMGQYNLDADVPLMQFTGGAGIPDLSTLQRDFLDEMLVTFGADEEIHGVQTTRLDVRVDAAALSGLMKSFAAGLTGAAADAEDVDMQFHKVNISYWMDPATGFVHRMTAHMAMSVAMMMPPSEVSAGGEMMMDIDLNLQMEAQPTSSPITWPDLSGAVEFVLPTNDAAPAGDM